MNSLENATEIARAAKQVLLPNRYRGPFVDAYQNMTELEVPELSNRLLKTISNGVTYRLSRGRDIPGKLQLLSTELPTVGFTGLEWCMSLNSNVDCTIVSQQKLGQVCLIASKSKELETLERLLSRNENISVVTAYSDLETWEQKQPKINLIAEVVVSGCVESWADVLNLPAVDLVSSGETINTNGFRVVKPLLDSYPVMLNTIQR